MKKTGLHLLTIIIFLIPALGFAQTDAIEKSELKTVIDKLPEGNNQSRKTLSELIYSRKILNFPETPHQEKEAALIRDYLTSQAEKGDPQAQVDLGLAYMFGNILPADPDNAFKWLNAALNNKNINKNKNLESRAQSFLAYLYLTGNGTKRDSKKAFELLKAAEKNNDRDALFGLGSYYMLQSYLDYNHVREHFKTAFQYFEKAAALSHPLAYHELAIMYQNGRGIGQDQALGMKYLEKSAQLGSSKARASLAYQYSLRGKKAEAVNEYKILAKTGSRKAMFDLGLAYHYGGNGVQQDHAESFKWFAKASEQYGLMSDYWQGVAYYKGQGVAQDYDKAFALFMADANRGNTLAMEYVGKMYIYGQGSVKQDIPLGCSFSYRYHRAPLKTLSREIAYYKRNKKELKKYFDPEYYKELWSCYEYTDKHKNIDEILNMIEEHKSIIKHTNAKETYREKTWYQTN